MYASSKDKMCRSCILRTWPISFNLSIMKLEDSEGQIEEESNADISVAAVGMVVTMMMIVRHRDDPLCGDLQKNALLVSLIVTRFTLEVKIYLYRSIGCTANHNLP